MCGCAENALASRLIRNCVARLARVRRDACHFQCPFSPLPGDSPLRNVKAAAGRRWPPLATARAPHRRGECGRALSPRGPRRDHPRPARAPPCMRGACRSTATKGRATTGACGARGRAAGAVKAQKTRKGPAPASFLLLEVTDRLPQERAIAHHVALLTLCCSPSRLMAPSTCRWPPRRKRGMPRTCEQPRAR